MSFLAPLFLAGAAAVALPILYHLIRRTSRERVLFSSLMFLAPTPPRLTRRSRLEHLLLLLLRCLVLALLAAGFARPFLKDRAAPPESGAEARHIVVLVDTSASMRRDNLWDDARSRVAALVREAGDRDEVAILAFSRQVTPVFRFDEWKSAAPGERAALAIGRINDLKPDWAATQLGQALIRGAETLAEAEPGKAARGPRRVVLISDLQEGAHVEALQGYEWPKDVELAIESIKPKVAGNAGIQLVGESGSGDSASAEPATRVRVSNASDSTVEQLVVGWGGSAAGQFAGKPVNVYVPPGQSRVVNVPVPAGAVGLDRIVLKGDAADFDNTVSVIPPEAQRSRVLYLGRDTEGEARQPLYFLRRALPQTRRQSIDVVVPARGSALTPETTGGAALLVVTDSLSAADAETVRAAALAGRTVLVTLRSAEAGATLARLIGVDSLPVSEAPVRDYAILAELDFQHPLLAPFADPRFGDFTKIHFWKHRKLDAKAIPGSRVVAKFDSGAPALLEVPAGRGRIVVLTSGWHSDDSQLALSTKFVPLLFSLLELGGGVPVAVAQYFVGDVVPVPAVEGKPTVIRTPEGRDLTLAAGATNFAQATVPGIYTLVGSEPLRRFAVNVDPSESRTARMPADEFERLGAPVKSPADLKGEPTPEKRALLLSTEAEARQKLWRWFIVGALALLLIETALAGWTMRQTTTPEGATT